jgi:NAD(P)-dependent dehydrogenase (short-subunit alcohol dehydrogenase family)
LTDLLGSLGAPAERCLATAADLSDPAAAKAWAEAVVKRFGRVDVVLHLVGGYKEGGSLADLPDADWNELHDMLIRTTMGVVRAFVEPLKAHAGRFISVTSPKAQAPNAKSALYSMGKAASDALVLALADELRGTGATANLLVVDSIDLPEARGQEKKKAYGRSTPAEQIAAAMLFLCSDQAATINGVRLPLISRG